MVFDANRQKRRSWRFCNSRSPRSEVVYLSQIIIINSLLTLSLAKVVFLSLDCEESIFPRFKISFVQSDTLFEIQIFESNYFRL